MIFLTGCPGTEALEGLLLFRIRKQLEVRLTSGPFSFTIKKINVIFWVGSTWETPPEESTKFLEGF